MNAAPPQPAPREVPGTIRQAEAFQIERERVAARRASPVGAPHRPPHETVGLALSGGGIRSATFSLGIIQAIGRRNLTRSIDYLSTVSGGSYIGAFFGSCFVPKSLRGDMVAGGAAIPDPAANPLLGAYGDDMFEHLRQSGRHLLPGTTGDAFRLAVILGRNWLAVQCVLGCSFLAVYMVLKPFQAFSMLCPWWRSMEAGWAMDGLPPWLWPTSWLAGFPFGHWLIASPLLPLSAILFLVTIALNWGYFHARGNPHMPPNRFVRFIGPSLAVVVIAVVIGMSLSLPHHVFWFMHVGAGLPGATGLGILLLGLAVLSVIAYGAAAILDKVEHPPEAAEVAEMPLAQEDRVRARITTWAGVALKFSTIVLVLGLLDTVAQSIYSRAGELWVPVSLGTIAGLAIPIFRWLLTSLPKLATGKSKLAAIARKSGRILALVGGIILLSVIALFWAVIAHYLAWRGGPIASMEMWVNADFAVLSTPWRAAVALTLLMLAFVGIAIFIGTSYAFINLSTYSHFYSTRLRRAYLGASNTDRYTPAPGVTPEQFDKPAIDSDEKNDDIGIDRYYDERLRGPVHLINITINDTASASSNTVQRDRRGKPLTVSPAGFLFAQASARDEIAGLKFPDRRDENGLDLLPLSAWVGLSGAAASTGLGQYGSLGLSLLTGLSNVRLGQWWDAGRPAVRRSKVRKLSRLRRFVGNMVQKRLADELLGKFPGSDARRWYLTDGGHFENTGAYELVRRRVAFIVLCDSGADPEYKFGDLVTLTRRIKIDFDAELTLLSEAELDLLLGPRTKIRQAFGNLEALALERTGDPRLGPYAALGRIRYTRPATSGQYPRMDATLLLIKPRVSGAEATDLAAYAKANPPFPQQSTVDQFYDEAQWESYYRLGLSIGEHVFDIDPNRWSPGRLRPLP